MIAFGHSAVGVIVGVTTYEFLGQDGLASGLIITGSIGIISHYLADFIPHGHFFKPNEYKKNILPVIIFDLLLPIILLLGIIYGRYGLSEKLLYIMFGIGASQLPDVIDGLVYIKILKAKGLIKIENNFHQALHWHGKGSKALLLGLRDTWQLLIILFALFLVIF